MDVYVCLYSSPLSPDGPSSLGISAPLCFPPFYVLVTSSATFFESLAPMTPRADHTRLGTDLPTFRPKSTPRRIHDPRRRIRRASKSIRSDG